MKPISPPISQLLAVENERLTFALQAAGVGTWNLDIANQQVWWDTRCQELFGFHLDDVVPYEQVMSYVHPDDRERVDGAVQQALDGQMDGHYDIQFRTLGAEDNQLRWLHCQGQAYFNDSKKAVRFSGTAQDVTSYHQAEAARLLAEEQFRVAVNYASLGIVIADPSGHILTANPAYCQITGYSVDELRQFSYQDFTHPDDVPRNRPLIEQISARQRPDFQIDKRYVRKDGSVVWVSINVAQVLDTEGNLTRIIGICQDITERRRAAAALEQSEEQYRTLNAELEMRVAQRTQDVQQVNQELQRSNESLLQFAYVASHDLQEPLRKIQSFSTLLEEQYGNELEQDGHDLLQRITKAGARMSLLIKDLLTYSRVSTRQQLIRPVALNSVFADVLTTLELEISQRQAHVTVGELPNVTGDAGQLEQLFQNLLSNALKFTPAGKHPQITVTHQRVLSADLPDGVKPVSDAGEFYEISVRDEGIGFDTKYLDRIFQVFQRLHGRNDYAGTGVGLAISQRVAQNHGGAISAISTPGSGATFLVYLPVEQ